ncbi:protein LIAT1 [Python bivittatus]|uniref:Protein LIAT1 n=1 Tax=Python bivittatus TaxID=176946 RepID=A0A9F5J068_PYTBI|nr:protein LIAT1 [Python bivittatus]
METGRRDASSEGEGAKGSKLAAKLPSSPGKKKASKKKKKKKKAVRDHEKTSSKSKKQPIFAIFPLHLLQRQHGTGGPQEDHARGVPGKAARRPLSASPPAISVLTPEDAGQPNESLRWDGVLEDPIAEEERLCNYRLNRRKRYGAFLQQSFPLEPSFPCKQLPELDKAAEVEKEHPLPKSKSSSIMATKSRRRPIPKLGTKISKKQPAVLQPSKSQGVL